MDEKLKANKGSTKTMKKLQDAVSKIDSEPHKNRPNTAIDNNKNMDQLLRGN